MEIIFFLGYGTKRKYKKKIFNIYQSLERLLLKLILVSYSRKFS